MTIETISIILTFITGIYAFLTYRILHANRQTIEEMKKQNEAFFRPQLLVNVFVPADSIIFYLRIKNVGRGMANEVRLAIDRDFFQFGEKKQECNIRSFSCFSNIIKSIPPDSELFFELAQDFVIFGEKSDPSITPKTFLIEADYNWGEKHYSETTKIDLSPYLNSVSSPESIPKELRAIKNVIAEAHKK